MKHSLEYEELFRNSIFVVGVLNWFQSKILLGGHFVCGVSSHNVGSAIGTAVQDDVIIGV
jgi:hypothetical protein